MDDCMDMELVSRAQQGEAGAFDELVVRYQGKVTSLVYRYVRNHDIAVDLVQDIFFKIYRNIKNFKGESKFSSWLFRIAVNDCIDHTRRKKVRKEQSLDTIQEYGFDVADPVDGRSMEGDLISSVEQKQVRQALFELPENQRSVVVMKVYQEMTFEQIAEILDQPVSTVKSRLYKALDTLGSTIRRWNVIREVKS